MYLFSTKNILVGAKMYLVNNVLENQIWAVPLLLKINLEPNYVHSEYRE